MIETLLAIVVLSLAVGLVARFRRLSAPVPEELPSLRLMERRQAKEVVDLIRQTIETARDADEAFEEMRKLIDPPKKGGPKADRKLSNIALSYLGIKPKESIEEYAKRIGQTTRPPRILLEEDEG